MKKVMFLLLFIPAALCAQIPDPIKGTYVNDSYGYLHDKDKGDINKMLHAIEKAYGVQVAVVLVPRIPEQYGIEDFAREIGRKWHVGRARNGIVYVAAIDERLQRLEIAEHLEGTIPDITAKRLTETVKPYFRSQKYGEGVMQLIKGIGDKLQPAKAEQNKLVVDQKKKEAGDAGTAVFIGLLLCLAAGCGASYFLYKRRKRLMEERARMNESNRQRFNHETGNYMYVPPPDFSTEDTRKSLDTYSTKKDDDHKGSTYSSGISSNEVTGGSCGSSYGNWGSGSTDSGSGSSDSGYSGGGSTDNW